MHGPSLGMQVVDGTHTTPGNFAEGSSIGRAVYSYNECRSTSPISRASNLRCNLHPWYIALVNNHPTPRAAQKKDICTRYA